MGVVTTIVLADGAVVVVQRAGPGDRERLRRTGERLREAAHPGVVVVRRSEPYGDGWELATDHAGAALTPGRVATPGRLAAVAASVAVTLAALHERGVVHGRLTTGRVLLGPAGRPVLCGFGPSAPAGGGPADDIAALGVVVLEHLEALGSLDPEGLRGAPHVRALVALAAAARAEPASRRPSARRLAADLAALATPEASRDRRPRRTTGAPVAVATAVAAALVATLSLRPGAADRSGADPAGAPPPVPTSSASQPAPDREPPCVARAGRPLTAARCGVAIAVERAAVVEDGARTVVGRPGDVVVVADWGCERSLRPAVLRPSTGEVLALSAVDGSGARHVEQAARIPGARDLVVTADADGCPQLLVAAAGGAPTAAFVADGQGSGG